MEITVPKVAAYAVLSPPQAVSVKKIAAYAALKQLPGDDGTLIVIIT